MEKIKLIGSMADGKYILRNNPDNSRAKTYECKNGDIDPTHSLFIRDAHNNYVSTDNTPDELKKYVGMGTKICTFVDDMFIIGPPDDEVISAAAVSGSASSSSSASALASALAPAASGSSSSSSSPTSASGSSSSSTSASGSSSSTYALASALAPAASGSSASGSSSTSASGSSSSSFSSSSSAIASALAHASSSGSAPGSASGSASEPVPPPKPVPPTKPVPPKPDPGPSSPSADDNKIVDFLNDIIKIDVLQHSFKMHFTMIQLYRSIPFDVLHELALYKPKYGNSDDDVPQRYIAKFIYILMVGISYDNILNIKELKDYDVDTNIPEIKYSDEHKNKIIDAWKNNIETLKKQGGGSRNISSRNTYMFNKTRYKLL